MNAQYDSSSHWPAIASKLEREKKADLIQLIQELTAVSPDAQRYLQTRYLQKDQTADSIAPYRQVIQDQFAFSEWGNTVSWNFSEVWKAIEDYAQSSRGDEKGVGELLIAALEIALAFADSLNLQDDDFDNDVTLLAERCVEQLSAQPEGYSPYARRLKKIQKIGNDLGYYALVETLETLTNPM